ncbi:MAG: DUF3108 domain-containing protein [Caldilineaceae bacterium]|nr:DUF3108 domain-containing protein [Caldilineaceae bacterium]
MRKVWNSGVGIFVLVAVLLLAACGGAEPVPLIFGDPVWRSGENSHYQVTDRTGKLVGTATVSLIVGNEESPDGWTLRREISAGQSEVATISLAGKGYGPVRSYLSRIDTSGAQQVEAAVIRSQVDITLTNKAGATTYERVSVPSDIRDERTLLTLARTLPLAEGYATRINSFMPIVGTVETMTVAVGKRERVTVPAGTYDTWLVEFSTPDRTTQAWISVDAPHPVVKFIDARSKGLFELTEFVAGE